jgi:hypothetical protein
LHLLASHLGLAVTYDQLINDIWGSPSPNVQLAVVRPGGRATAEPSSFVKSLWAISLDSSRNSAQPIIWPIVWWLSFIEYMMSPAPNQPVKSE